MKLGDHRLPREALQRYSGVVLSGGRILMQHPELLTAAPTAVRQLSLDVEAVLEAQVPVLGVCLGHLILCEVFGARLGRMPALLDEERDVQVLEPDRILAGLSGTVRVRQAHQDRVEELPSELRCLATSDTSPFEAVRHATRPLFGVQFHPEASGEVGRQVLTNFLEVCQPSASTSSTTSSR
jgi:GMP synthase (glutamine-hydrolysing)